jgi:hypothetical protein
MIESLRYFETRQNSLIDSEISADINHKIEPMKDCRAHKWLQAKPDERTVNRWIAE